MNARAVTLVLISSLLGLVACLVPAEAQQTQRVFRVGVLNIGSPPTNPLSSPGYSQIVERLAELGFRQGQNLTLEYRWAEGNLDRVQPLAVELMEARVDVIVAIGSKLTQILAAAKPRVPMVSVSCDLFSMVASYARPNGNFTGVTCMTTELSPKRLELVKQIVPGAKQVVFLHDPDQSSIGLELTRKAASRVGLAIRVVEIRSVAEMGKAFAAIALERPDVLLVHPDSLTIRLRKEIAEFALAQRLPSIYAYGESVEAGGLVSYGATTSELGETAGDLTGKILRGAKPHELPIRQVLRLHLTINMKTAKTLGIKVPPSILLRADRVIE